MKSGARSLCGETGVRRYARRTCHVQGSGSGTKTKHQPDQTPSVFSDRQATQEGSSGLRKTLRTRTTLFPSACKTGTSKLVAVSEAIACTSTRQSGDHCCYQGCAQNPWTRACCLALLMTWPCFSTTAECGNQCSWCLCTCGSWAFLTSWKKLAGREVLQCGGVRTAPERSLPRTQHLAGAVVGWLVHASSTGPLGADAGVSKGTGSSSVRVQRAGLRSPPPNTTARPRSQTRAIQCETSPSLRAVTLEYLRQKIRKRTAGNQLGQGLADRHENGAGVSLVCAQDNSCAFQKWDSPTG